MSKHRGEILETYLRNSGVNLTKLAEKLPWTVKTIYRHFKEAELPFEKLLEYSKATNYDFEIEFPELDGLRKQMTEPFNGYLSKPGNGLSEAEYYRNKYEQILEKYNEMLERYNALLVQRMPS